MTVRSGTIRSGTVLDAADLAVIAGRVLGIGSDAALAQMDLAAVRAALAEAGLIEAALVGDGLLGDGLAEATLTPAWLARVPRRPAPLRDRADAAAAGVALVHALLRHRPFPRQCEQVAVAAGLQFLSLNGWQADLNPPAPAAVVVEALASGQLSPDAAASWLSPRLSPARRDTILALGITPARRRLAPARRRSAPVRPGPHRAGRGSRRPRPIRISFRRSIASVLLALAVGGISLLAAACSRAPSVPAPAHSATAHSAAARAHSPAH